MSRYELTKEFILGKIERELSPTLTYHSINHVIDVLTAATYLAKAENISEAETELLKVAVLFHDSGFIVSSEKHEEQGCEYAKKFLPDFGYNEQEITEICKIIMATKFPHKPESHLQQIICDADLDYLGREDFYTIGDLLFQELKSKNAVADFNEWNKMQIKFLEAHTYFTKSAKALRRESKLRHIEEIKGKILNFES